MASNYTTNYQLNQWEAGDQVLRTEFNQDNQKIDGALKANAEAIAAEVADREAAGTALETTLAGKGNCQIELKTYTGTGTYGSGNRNSLTFSSKPTVVLLIGDRTWAWFLYGTSYAYGISDDGVISAIDQSWTGNTVQFYSSRADLQMNSDEKIYWALAFCAADDT